MHSPAHVVVVSGLRLTGVSDEASVGESRTGSTGTPHYLSVDGRSSRDRSCFAGVNRPAGGLYERGESSGTFTVGMRGELRRPSSGGTENGSTPPSSAAETESRDSVRIFWS